MKHSLFIAFLLVLLFTFAMQTADARSGCCSHHGGVCGCGCCDGSPLSAICSPYYPDCISTTSTTTNNSQVLQTTEPQVTRPPVTRVQFTPHPTATLTPTSTPTVTLKPTKAPTPKPTKKAVQFSKPKPQSETFWTELLKFFHLEWAYKAKDQQEYTDNKETMNIACFDIHLCFSPFNCNFPSSLWTHCSKPFRHFCFPSPTLCSSFFVRSVFAWCKPLIAFLVRSRTLRHIAEIIAFLAFFSHYRYFHGVAKYAKITKSTYYLVPYC